MNPKAWITVAVVVCLILVIAVTSVGMDLVFLAALTVLVLTHVLTTTQAFAGFANESMLAIGVIYVLVAGLRETGAVSVLARVCFGKPKNEFDALLRLLLSTTAISAWVYDNPLVAMLLPTVDAWAKRYQIPVSRLLIPLSYAALLGGGITLVGTSTNLIVDGLIRKSGLAGFTLFQFTPVGLPVALAGIVTIAGTSRWLLPRRSSPVDADADFKEYAAEVVVDPKGPLAGVTIETAGLRKLSDSYVAEVDRGEEHFVAVGPDFLLQGNDRLTLVGGISSVVDSRRIHGLIPGGDQVSKLALERRGRVLLEAVVSKRCPLVGKSVREGKFRTRYNAVIIAIARDGERIDGKIGDVVLRAGDLLLLEALPSFAEQQRNSKDFFVVSLIPDSRPVRHKLAPLAILIVVSVIAASALNLTSLLVASLVGAGVMVATRCVSSATARQNVDWTVLVVIASSFGLSTALEQSGAGEALSGLVLHFAGSAPIGSLIAVYAVATLFTEFLSHHAAAAIMVPISLALAKHLHVSPYPFAIAIVIATAIGFATPVAHQTNLMVFGPGGYRFADYLRLGLLLDLVCGAVAIFAIYQFIPF